MAIVGLDADWLFHVAQVGLLLSNVFASMLLVRIFLFAGFFVLGLWGLLVLDAFAATVAWMSVFCAINLVHIVRIIYQMRKITLAQEEEEIFSACFLPFANFDRREFKALYDVGCDRFCEEGMCTGSRSLARALTVVVCVCACVCDGAGDVLLQEGEPYEYVGFLIRGKVLKFASATPLNSIARKSNNEWAFFGRYARCSEYATECAPDPGEG